MPSLNFNALLIGISFLITAFGQPAWIRGCGMLAAALGFALFWKGMLTFPKARDRFLLAFTWFSAVQAVQLSWMTTIDYMGPLILLVYLCLILGMGIQFGVLSLCIEKPISWHRGVALAGGWVLFEWMRLFVLCGFTWNPIGLALTDSPYSLQFASVWGIFGLSFWVILVNVAALKAWIALSPKQIALWASLALFPYLFGIVHQTWIEARIPPTQNLTVALVHTNLTPEQKEFCLKESQSYIPPWIQWERILKALPSKEVDLIVFPEAALPLGAHTVNYPLSALRPYFDPGDFPQLKYPLAVFERGAWKVSNAFVFQTLANHYKAHVIVGLDDHEADRSYNAAFHFHPNNLPYERYEKQILVPIVEYIPLRQWRRLVRFIGEEFGIYSSFERGVEGKIFTTQIPIGVSICVEETFAHLVRELRVKGAELLVNVTNDVWFPRSKLARQHFDHGRVRAAENGVPLLRACNAGISGGVDCFGRPIHILQDTHQNVDALHFTFPVRSYPTLYTFWGDFAILGISLSAITSYFLFRKKKLP